MAAAVLLACPRAAAIREAGATVEAAAASRVDMVEAGASTVEAGADSIADRADSGFECGSFQNGPHLP
jgi:hypothetical protein